MIKSTFFALLYDEDAMLARLGKPLTRAEGIALTVALAVVIGMGIQHIGHVYAFQYDLGNYLNAVKGNTSHYYYAYWFLPVLQVLSLFPFWLAFILWNFFNIGGIFIASRIFNREAIWLLTGYQAVYTFFQGNITGILAGSLALFWLFLQKKRWHLAGFFLLLAATKFQIGIPLGGILWLAAPYHWKEKLRVFLVPLLLTSLSLMAYGFWPLYILQSLEANPPNALGSIALWQWTGPWILILPFGVWALFKNRPSLLFLALIECIFLALPYLQQNDLLIFFLFVPSVFPILGNIGYILAWLQFDNLKFLFLLPLLGCFMLLYAFYRDGTLSSPE